MLQAKLGPHVRLAKAKSDSELASLTEVGSLQLTRNIVTEFDSVRAKLSSRSFLLSSGDTVLITLMKLYHDVIISFLAFLFRIHRTTASENVKMSLCVLSKVLGSALYVPCDQSIENNLTVYFKSFLARKLFWTALRSPSSDHLTLHPGY